MKIRTTALILAFSLWGTALSGQQSAMRPDTHVRAPQVDVLASAIDSITRMHRTGFADSTLWQAAFDGMLESLDDPYAAIFTPSEAEEWGEETTGNYAGIGLQITLLNDQVTVTAVFRGTPANDVGILLGDRIVGVNDHDASSWDTDMAADSIRGPVGTHVTVKIAREGFSEPMSFDITRAEVHVPAVHYGVLEGGIGYALLDRVARNAATELDAALARLGRTKGLIIDLRGNPGGFLDESILLADIFLKPGQRIASTTQRISGGTADQTSVDTFSDHYPQRVPNLPIVVLVDRFTASGAEIMAGALQDYDRALVLGERTFGKGVVQTVMPMPHGWVLRFTTGSWLTPLGRSLQRARDREFRLLPENLDSVPRVLTPAGRELIDGGGIFPDLAIQQDTLTLRERDFLRVVGEEQYPVGLRLAEFGFQVATEQRAANAPPALSEERFAEFSQRLIDEGLPADLINDPEVHDYLLWRARITVAERMDDIGHEADFRMSRDPVLTEAVKLINGASSQADLFAAAGAEAQARTGTTGGR